MPMTEFPRFAMGDSGACSGKRARHLANCGLFPLRPVTKRACRYERGLAQLRPYQRLWSGGLVGRDSVKPSEIVTYAAESLYFDHAIRPPRPRMGGNQRNRAP